MRGWWVGGWVVSGVAAARLPRSALCSRNASCLGYHTVQVSNAVTATSDTIFLIVTDCLGLSVLVTTQTSTSTLT